MSVSRTPACTARNSSRPRKYPSISPNPQRVNPGSMPSTNICSIVMRFARRVSGLLLEVGEDLVGDVEVRVDVLHVVVVIDGVHQSQNLLGLALFLDGNEILRHQRKVGADDAESETLESVAHHAHFVGFGRDDEVVALGG